MSLNKFPEISNQEKIAQLKKQIKVLSILQFVMPLLMVLMAYAISSSMPLVAPETKNFMMTLLYIFAALDFVLIRVFLLPAARKRLAALENGQ